MIENLKLWIILPVHEFVAGLASSVYGLCGLGFEVIYNSTREVFLRGP